MRLLVIRLHFVLLLVLALIKELTAVSMARSEFSGTASCIILTLRTQNPAVLLVIFWQKVEKYCRAHLDQESGGALPRSSRSGAEEADPPFP